ncbi:hypothetical protein A3E65_00845 [Candidatus Kaiserbacteria bacterium RIFCSPHIGHO2_12_FULL_56_13]|uniref:Uncharacterized protein n=2 Tax=Candidatus Kaiseribacteriota TaxID=1752734 RepID=A0A1F6E4E1_9BACT|nr:MAG: hypothetical protein A3C95_01755 [Candidatus Kaiserbacteria bacterium RIFCSPHIGHO2_02_FULL_56_30]OGG72124.1 MAG: hypothetical protein A3E65_00845 [Candidatus Kaiserbacteria bacterium RIFCSPHIGHO2_12_FULL_56_13]
MSAREDRMQKSVVFSTPQQDGEPVFAVWLARMTACPSFEVKLITTVSPAQLRIDYECDEDEEYKAHAQFELPL